MESIDPDEADERFGARPRASRRSDPHPRVISVRQRRDYRVPSVAALLRVAEAARREGTPEDDEPAPVEGVGEAVLELLQSGDGSLGALDVPELEPLDGVVMVSEVGTPVDLESFDDDDAVGPFQPAADDRLVGRLDEHPFLDLDDDHDHAEQPALGRPRPGPGACGPGRAARRSVRQARLRLVDPPAAQHHLPRAVPEQPHPGQLPAGELRLDRQLRRGGQPVDVRRQPQRRVFVVHASMLPSRGGSPPLTVTRSPAAGLGGPARPQPSRSG